MLLNTLKSCLIRLSIHLSASWEEGRRACRLHYFTCTMAPIFVLLTILAAGVVAQEDLNSTEVTQRTDLKIVRGQNAVRGQFPWQVWMECVRTNFIKTACGGSLISTRHILTAAHCLDRVILCKVSLGLVSLTDRGYSYFLRSSDMIVHEMYRSNNYDHDIAIMRLLSPIMLTENIQPIRLANQFENSRTLSGVLAVVSGWGKTRDDEKVSHNFLQYANVRIMPENTCNAYFMKNFGLRITNGQICTDFSSSNICNGDSGGPLAIFEGDNNWTLIGIVSLGVSPCEEVTPSVYTSVAGYLSWINQNAR